jgi:hypothetical protein
MTTVATYSQSDRSIVLLSKLLLPQQNGVSSGSPERVELQSEICSLDREGFEDLLSLSQSNHVIVRGMTAIRHLMDSAKDSERAKWAEDALANERARIETALTFLHSICAAFERQGLEIAVIKSLDHWPDIGSDLDLYTNAKQSDVFKLMRMEFNARVASQSWGDRLAHKWNFIVPGLPEAVEVHVGRLGQMGEQASLASGLLNRSKPAIIGSREFNVTSNSDRLMISTLQRMYRHFYFRLCDVIDTATLSDARMIDFVNLCSLARRAGIWEGVATYLTTVSDYVESYRGRGLNLPGFVPSSARFRGDAIFYKRGFLRVPIMPQSVRLYGSQLAKVFARGELYNGARLSLLPWLATAAVVGQKLTGSDKGVW